MTRFDASVDLTVHNVSAGVSPEVALEQVRAAVEALPGAGWISVEWCGSPPPCLTWLRVYKPGRARERQDGAYGLIREQIEAIVRDTVG